MKQLNIFMHMLQLRGRDAAEKAILCKNLLCTHYICSVSGRHATFPHLNVSKAPIVVLQRRKWYECPFSEAHLHKQPAYALKKSKIKLTSSPADWNTTKHILFPSPTLKQVISRFIYTYSGFIGGGEGRGGLLHAFRQMGCGLIIRLCHSLC